MYLSCENKRWDEAVALTESSNKNDLDRMLRYKGMDGDTALHNACITNVPSNILHSMFTNILEKGINLQQILSITNDDGRLVLHRAAGHCSLDTLKLVVLHSPDTALTTKDSDGDTPLEVAGGGTEKGRFLESVSNVRWDM